MSGTRLFMLLCFGTFWFLILLMACLGLGRHVGAQEPAVSIRVLKDAVECHVPHDDLNRWLDIVVEDVTGSGHDLTDTEQTTFSLALPDPLYCPFNVETATASCEVMYYDRLLGKMRDVRASAFVACLP